MESSIAVPLPDRQQGAGGKSVHQLCAVLYVQKPATRQHNLERQSWSLTPSALCRAPQHLELAQEEVLLLESVQLLR